jgi:hypothetical protein
VAADTLAALTPPVVTIFSAPKLMLAEPESVIDPDARVRVPMVALVVAFTVNPFNCPDVFTFFVKITSVPVVEICDPESVKLPMVASVVTTNFPVPLIVVAPVPTFSDPILSIPVVATSLSEKDTVESSLVICPSENCSDPMEEPGAAVSTPQLTDPVVPRLLPPKLIEPPTSTIEPADNTKSAPIVSPLKPVRDPPINTAVPSVIRAPSTRSREASFVVAVIVPLVCKFNAPKLMLELPLSVIEPVDIVTVPIFPLVVTSSVPLLIFPLVARLRSKKETCAALDVI